MTTFSEEVLSRIQQVAGVSPVHLHEPSLGEPERLAVSECINSGYVSSIGESIGKFEQLIKERTGSNHAIAVSSGTAALQLALIGAGVKQNDEVLMPALSFVATANAVSHLGAVPHFIDIEPDNLGLSPEAVQHHLEKIGVFRDGRLVNRVTERPITAIVPMHCFGQPLYIEELVEIADYWGIALVEDAAEALGSSSGGRACGTFGIAGIFSFNGNKIVTTGGGGAVVTNSDKIAQKLRHLATTARLAHPWEIAHDSIGFNYRMPNLNASLGVAQLLRLDGFLRSKSLLAERYDQAFGDFPQVRLLKPRANTVSNFWLNTLLLDGSMRSERDRILHQANLRGVFLRAAWMLLPNLKPYAKAPRGSLSNATAIQPRIINLPSSSFLVSSS